MLSVKLITPRKINRLYMRGAVCLTAFAISIIGYSQDNSPYSRYGIGDLVPNTHINSRGQGGIAAGVNEFGTINFSNPASYSNFQVIREQNSKKIVSGRAILDVGINFETRKLIEPATAKEFTAGNALFSYLQLGVAVKRNWGVTLGLRPISRISYKMFRREVLYDPNTNRPIDSANTRFEGDGGMYLASLGTGISLFQRDKTNGLEQRLSVGVNSGYIFGKKDYSTRRSIFNDTVDYYQANYETKTSVGGLYLSGGLQYEFPISVANRISMTLGAFGNLKHNLTSRQDIIRETFIFDQSLGDVRLDSVSEVKDIKGKLIYPSDITVGFVTEKFSTNKNAGWLIGADFTYKGWDQYRFYGQADSVQNNWELHVGAQLRPAIKRNYFSNVAYRVGMYYGPDYIKVGQKLSQLGFSLGLGLPVANYRSAYASLNQVTFINLAFEYGKRGNNENLLKENLFRVSVGFSLSDFWFQKRKYE